MKIIKLSYILVFISYLINGYSCFSFDRVVSLDPRKENNISIVASFVDTSSTFYIYINKIGRLDTVPESFYMEKLYIKDASIYLINPEGKKYTFLSKELLNHSWVYYSPKFTITNGDHKLIVEWNQSQYEAICKPTEIPSFEKLEIIPVLINNKKATTLSSNIYPPIGSNESDFSNWCDVYCSFSVEKDKEIFYIIETNRFSLNSFINIDKRYGNKIRVEELGTDFFYKHPENFIRYYIDQKNVEKTSPFNSQYPNSGFGINVGDTVKTRIFSLNLLQVKLEDSRYTPTLNRTNIKNITDPSKPPIGYFVINRYAEKITIRKN